MGLIPYTPPCVLKRDAAKQGGQEQRKAGPLTASMRICTRDTGKEEVCPWFREALGIDSVTMAAMAIDAVIAGAAFAVDQPHLSKRG